MKSDQQIAAFRTLAARIDSDGVKHLFDETVRRLMKVAKHRDALQRNKNSEQTPEIRRTSRGKKSVRE